VCFDSSVFGRNKSNIYVMNKIANISYDAKKGILTLDHKAKKDQFLSIKDGDTFVKLLISVWEEVKQKQGKDSKKSKENKNKTKQDHKPIKKSITISNDGNITMSSGDWAIVNKGANLVTFKDGEAIIQEGKEHHRIYQLATGRCIIKKTTAEGDIILGHTQPPALFGEMTFLENGKATASVIATGDDCSVYIVEGFYINTLFVDYPVLAGRFYSFLASVLAKRLSDREDALAKVELERYEKKLKVLNRKSQVLKKGELNGEKRELEEGKKKDHFG